MAHNVIAMLSSRHMISAFISNFCIFSPFLLIRVHAAVTWFASSLIWSERVFDLARYKEGAETLPCREPRFPQAETLSLSDCWNVSAAGPHRSLLAVSVHSEGGGGSTWPPSPASPRNEAAGGDGDASAPAAGAAAAGT